MQEAAEGFSELNNTCLIYSEMGQLQLQVLCQICTHAQPTKSPHKKQSHFNIPKGFLKKKRLYPGLTFWVPKKLDSAHHGARQHHHETGGICSGCAISQ